MIDPMQGLPPCKPCSEGQQHYLVDLLLHKYTWALVRLLTATVSLQCCEFCAVQGSTGSRSPPEAAR